MESFLNTIPNAAVNAYAFASYVVAVIAFLVASFKLRRIKILSEKINSKDSPAERIETIKIVTGDVVPKSITAEQWLRNNKAKWILLVCAGVILAIAVVSIVAIVEQNGNSATQRQFSTIIDNQNEASLASLKLRYPLEDAIFDTRFSISTDISAITAYIESVRDQLQDFLDDEECLSPDNNDFVLLSPTFQNANLCELPTVVQITPHSPLFPTGTSVAAESFDRLEISIDFLEQGDRGTGYLPGNFPSVLRMNKEATSSTQTELNRESYSGLVLELDLISKKASVLMQEMISPESSWLRRPDVFSIVDLLSTEMVIYSEIGTSSAFPEEVNKVQDSLELESLFLKIGSMRIPSAKPLVSSDMWGRSIYIYQIPARIESL